MPTETRKVSPGPTKTSVLTDTGQVLQVPKHWKLLPPGDAGLTRRVKASGPTWTVQEKRGRRTFSQGVWAPAEQIDAHLAKLEAERATPAYAKRRQADANRREQKQTDYVKEFRSEVIQFFAFDPQYAAIAFQMADAVTKHATPVGSGTVARTQRIPVQKRAESAVIAWLRHQTTAYDDMKIARIKGKRREVRQMLAQQSRVLLKAYRSGESIDAELCPLRQALRSQSVYNAKTA
ncbi:MAG: hypothetical protein COA78_09920 [Blastopirellula sp.]|nr:MAG: hypothetical protein COA78_09920 [Blastopirellula sp.]